ncbi:MAG: glycosyltransferase [Candidatus Eisenbacteria bacterium]|nr:glycosyltransferase [Candidatus Eisenbacteria bacterium]
MRVAHLDTGRGWRGGQAQVRFLLRGLRARGHDCLLLAPPGPLAERARAEGFAVLDWAPRGEWDLGAAWRAARLLRAFAPHVAHCHSAHAHALGVPAARRAGVPVVVVSRRVDFAVAGNPLSRLKYRMPVDRYLCISRGVVEVMRSGGVPQARLALVPSGIELPAADAVAPRAAADLRAALGAPPDAPVVGTVAALAPHKDHANLLEAAALVVRARPDVRFAWLGEGECRAALERRRAALGLAGHVHLLGFRGDALDLLRQFTVFCLASHLEGLCTSLLDAQSLGVPVVATAVGGVPDVVEDGVSGRLVPGGDPAALARALLEALTRADLSRAWAEQARVTVRRFSADHMVERTLEEYRSALRGRGVVA